MKQIAASRITIATLVVTSCIVATLAGAAEIQLRGECRPTRSLVLLRDLADIYAADESTARLLQQVELFPAPPQGVKKFVRVREIQDLLAARGVNLVEHTFSGSSQVVVQTENEPVPQPVTEKPLAAWQRERAATLVQDAARRALSKAAKLEMPWQVEAKLSDEQVKAIMATRSGLVLVGGSTPWEGPQRFVAILESATGQEQLALTLQVSLPPAVVAAVRSLPKGAIVGASDVQLVRGEYLTGKSEPLRTFEEVVGKETTRAVGVGRLFDKDSIRDPILVQKGQAVTVYARRPGIQIRTLARAREDGSLGQVIVVESLSDRTTFNAKVSGVQQAEVEASATPSLPTASSVSVPRR